MDIKSWSYIRAIKGDKMLFEGFKGREIFKISNDDIPIFCGAREEAMQLCKYLSVPYLARNWFGIFTWGRISDFYVPFGVT